MTAHVTTQSAPLLLCGDRVFSASTGELLGFCTKARGHSGSCTTVYTFLPRR